MTSTAGIITASGHRTHGHDWTDTCSTENMDYTDQADIIFNNLNQICAGEHIIHVIWTKTLGSFCMTQVKIVLKRDNVKKNL